MAVTSVPDRGDDPRRSYDVGKYSITYGYNEHTRNPEAWAESGKTWRSHASTMDDDGNITHGSRGTNPVPDKYARNHIEKTLPKMRKMK